MIVWYLPLTTALWTLIFLWQINGVFFSAMVSQWDELLPYVIL